MVTYFTILKLTLKKVKTWNGREGQGLQCELFFNNKKVADFTDEAYGGEARIDFTSKDAEKEVKDYLEKEKCAEDMFKHGWDFMGSSDEIDFDSQVNYLVDAVYNKSTQEKAEKKHLAGLEKKMQFGFLIGKQSEYPDKCRTWMYKVPMVQIPKETLQKHYADVVKKATANGEVIFNTNLVALGLV